MLKKFLAFILSVSIGLSSAAPVRADVLTESDLRLSGPALDAEIARMEALLDIRCDPVIQVLTQLLQSGRAYREAISRIENDYSRERERLTSLKGEFALPSAEAAKGIGVSFRFFTAFTALRESAEASGMLGPPDLPDNSSLNFLALIAQRGPAAVGLGTNTAGQGLRKLDAGEAAIVGLANSVFFAADSDQDAAFIRQRRTELEKQFADLRAAYEARREEMLSFYAPDKIAALNRFYGQDAIQRVDQLRDTYRNFRSQVEELALSRRMEHCLGPIESDVQQSVVGGFGVNPFLLKGADNTVNGIPGMGFALNVKPEIGPFQPVAVPPFGFKFKLKLDARAIAQLQTERDVREALRIAERIKENAGVFADTSLESYAAALRETGDKTLGFLGDAIVGLAAMGKSLIVDHLGNPVAMLAQAQVNAARNAGDNSEAVRSRLGDDIAKIGNAVDGFVTDMAESIIAYDQLVAQGLIDGESGIVDLQTIELGQQGLTAEQQADRASLMLDSLKEMDEGIDKLTTAGGIVVSVIVEEVATLGITKLGAKAAKDLLTTKSKKSISKLGDAAKKLEVSAQGNTGRAIAIQDEIRQTQNAIDDVTRKQAALDQQIKDFGDPLDSGPLNGTKQKFGPTDPENTRVIGFANNADGTVTPINGEFLGGGAGSKAFANPDAPNTVFRTTPLENSQAIATDGLSRKVAREANLDPKAVQMLEPTEVRIVTDSNGKQVRVETVERVTPARDMLKAQGDRMTPGQANALKNAKAEMNSKGLIWTDGKKGNFAFVNTSTPPGADQWTVKILDPGGVIKLNPVSAAVDSASDAAAIQKALDDVIASGVTDNQFGIAANASIKKAPDGSTIGEAMRRNGIQDPAGDAVPGATPLALSPPSAYPDGLPRDASFSEMKAAQQAAMAERKALVDQMQALSKKSDDLGRQVDDLTVAKTGAAAEAQQQFADAGLIRGEQLENLKQLAELEKVRPNAVAAAARAITDNARRAMFQLGKAAAKDSIDAFCKKLRAIIAAGDPSEEVMKLAAEKCGLVNAGGN